MPKTTRIREQDSGRTGLRIVEVINGDGTYTELAQAGAAALGLVELATSAEAVTGTDTERAVTPVALAAAAATHVPQATETVQGKVELATTVEAAAGADTERAVTAAGLAAYCPAASTTAAGKAELATNAEAAAESDTGRVLTPSNLRQGAPALGAGTLEAAFAQHYKILPAADSATAVLAATPLTDAPQSIVAGITSPDVPRTVTVQGNAAGMAGNVVVHGTDIEGGTISDTIALNGTNEVEGIKAFRTVTQIDLPVQTHDPDSAQQETAVIVGTITTTGDAKVTVTAAGSPALAAGKDIAVAVSQGVKQQETATIVGAITGDGDAKITVTAAGSPALAAGKDVAVAVLAGVFQQETATAAGTITTSGDGKATVTAANSPALAAGKDVAFAVSQGVKQQETAVVVGEITTSGNAKFTVTAAGSPALAAGKDVSVAVLTGTAQEETATVVAPANITAAGFCKAVLTAAGMTGSPITTQEYVAVGDTAAEVAAALRARLALDARITAMFTVGGAGADILLTRLVKAANDGTLNLTVENDGCAGITDDLTSADTTAGVASDDAVAVAGKARTALGLDADVAAFFDIGGADANVILTAKAEAANDATMNIAYDNDTCAGLTPDATSDDTRAGVAADGANQIATAVRTALGLDADVSAFFTIAGAGADILLTAKAKAANDATMNLALIDDTCVGVTPAANSADTTAGVAQDDASGVASKARTALGLDADVVAFFTIAGAGADIILTAIAEAADDATMNIASDNDTCTGLTAQATSANTTAGVAPDDASAVATLIRAALALDADVVAFFTVGGAGANVELTAIVLAPNDPTMNIAYDNDSCAGLTPDATSTDTTAGAYDTVSAGRAKKFGLPHIVDFAGCLLVSLFKGAADAGSLAVDDDEIEKNLYAMNGNPDGGALDLYYLV